MFDLMFLGTSASAPSIHRGLSATAVLAGEERFLVDCGEGTQRQILRSGIGFKRLNRILVTHPHLDHLLGIGGIASTFGRWEAIDDLNIWGSRESLSRIHSLVFDVVYPNQQPPVPINLNLVDAETDELQTIYQAKNYQVQAFRVRHRGRGCYGYVFEEFTRRPFLNEKAEALGIPAGPERARLVRGEAITLTDGRTIAPDEVLGEPIEGVKVVLTGDVAQLDGLESVIYGADLLVTEATFLDSDAEMARQYGHITAGLAARFARDNAVDCLVLNHISRRYREREMIQEARQYFDNSYVARDLQQFSVRKGNTQLLTASSGKGAAELDADEDVEAGDGA